MSDLIDRQKAIEMLEKGIREYSNEYGISDAICDLDDMPSAEPEPLTVNFARELDRETIEKLKDSIKNAPILIMAVNDFTPTAEPKRGKWIQTDAKDCRRRTSLAYLYKCNQCGYEDWFDSNFCPSCGADMRGEQDE